MQHWLPYDERRLYGLLGVDRGDIWRWLRGDEQRDGRVRADAVRVKRPAGRPEPCG